MKGNEVIFLDQVDMKRAKSITVSSHTLLGMSLGENAESSTPQAAE